MGRHCDREAANHESDGSSWRLRVGLFNIRYPPANLTPVIVNPAVQCDSADEEEQGSRATYLSKSSELVSAKNCSVICHAAHTKIERFVLSARELVDGVPKRPFSSHLTHTHSRAVMWEGVTCIASH